MRELGRTELQFRLPNGSCKAGERALGSCHLSDGGAVRNRCCVWLWLFIFGAMCSAAQRGAEGSSAGEQFLGTWTGTWDGAGSGGFELTMEKDNDGALTGKVSVTGEPTYRATFKALSFDGKKMSAKYDFPPDGSDEVVLAASFDGNTATGTWSLREQANGNEVVTGTWSVTRRGPSAKASGRLD